MPFDDLIVQELMVACHRRCCVCHRYCGFRMEIDHIVPRSNDGEDSKDNAIAVCFDCHAEIHHYNPSHPKGRRFRPNELRAHRDQWLAFCASNPAALASGVPPAEGGALERLAGELAFNEHIAGSTRRFAAFEMAQFRRAIADGALRFLDAQTVSAIYEAYAAISDINTRALGIASIEHTGRRHEVENNMIQIIRGAKFAISGARSALERESSDGK